MACPRCGDWGSVAVRLPGAGFHAPCPVCRASEYVAWASGEQGPDVEELEAERLRLEIARLRAELAERQK